MDDYSRGGHTKHSLKVHLIFVTTYRKRIFDSVKCSEDVKQFLYDAARKAGCHILQMETDKDHVHILLGYRPDRSISEIARILKQYSTHDMWKMHGAFLSRRYWKRKVLWSDGYFACSIGQVSQKTIEQYIKNQG